MRSSFISVIVFCFLLFTNSFSSFSQVQKHTFFQNYQAVSNEFKGELTNGELAFFNHQKASKFLLSAPDSFHFIFNFEGTEWELVLHKSNLLSPTFFVTTGKSSDPFIDTNTTALHYKGFIKGHTKSFAAVSIMANGIVAVIADETGNINIGAVNTPGAKAKGTHIIYREKDLLGVNTDQCGTEDNISNTERTVPIYNNATSAATVNTIPINVYFEADYDLYLHHDSSVTNTVDYVTALFNVVNTLYENDSINIVINSIKVWDIPDPYISIPTMQAILPVFSSNMGIGFPGDLAHLLTYRGVGGGISYLNVLCDIPRSKTGISGSISNAITSFPTYSRSVLYITHEIGHNLGSPHTQSCTWPGGAIDNCAAPENGSCTPGPPPINGGTIMSYCQATAYGTNFLNGFGPLPGDYIRNNIRTNICLNPTIIFSALSLITREEEADVEADCFDYKIYHIYVRITKPPSQPANITLTPTAIGNLIIGHNKDLEILSPLSFTLDSTHLTDTLSFKVFNDNIIEGVERVNFAVALNANGGNARLQNATAVFAVLIVSDDHVPEITANQFIFVENFDTVTTGLGNWTQTVVYGDSSPNRWVIGGNADAEFPSKAAYISNNGSALAYSGSTFNDSTIVRLESPIISTMGFSAVNLNYSIKVAGENLYQPTGPNTGISSFADGGKIYYSTDGGLNWTPSFCELRDYPTRRISACGLGVNASNQPNLKIAFEWHNNSNIVKLPALIIDSILMKGTSVAPIQITAHPHNFNEAYIGPNDTVHFYNPVTKNIIASIENNSSFDFGCTSLELLRTGNNATFLYDSIPFNQISDKVFRITTTNNNPAAAFKIKLYYTASEINGWLQATGNNFSDIRIAKSTENLSLPTTTGTPQISSLNNNTPYGAFGSYTFSAGFTGTSNSATFALMKPHGLSTCVDSTVIFKTAIAGTSYQWQVNNGSGFVNIDADNIYLNTATDSLQITNAPTGYFGNIYRCQITTYLGIVYSEEFGLKKEMLWTGTVNNIWEEPLNWSCNKVPDEKTDVIILRNTPFKPTLNSVTGIRSLSAFSGADITIKSGAVLNILK